MVLGYSYIHFRNFRSLRVEGSVILGLGGLGGLGVYGFEGFKF